MVADDEEAEDVVDVPDGNCDELHVVRRLEGIAWPEVGRLVEVNVPEVACVRPWEDGPSDPVGLP